mmetsp:Transcript_23386/g.34788  ORF Transcript_23386/g.34788 Transcript_23386/m.34788 type:complete len:473 (-) Transcript_23386:47-1465(-)|eukprot:CAMPEP_0203663274 /NCGR_PEP_ID=MMETSP0090-20130426/919_1 /ASSEMBLY_ACC=CAM_ASM_001088 /TAXON_ID=426623 /ORGANISM="Chaetoceros affinis, Strain CCMP159" /LENGTH=472 /DNA_ID=CAMNT_0050526161 /DNA_START=43 /DNA_END=1461 /DNA_ORIENTATION=+
MSSRANSNLPKLTEITSLVESIEARTLSVVERDTEMMDEINNVEKVINLAFTEMAEKEEIQGLLSKHLIRTLLLKCQLLGKKSQFEQIIEIADTIVLKLNELSDDVPYDYRSSIEAAALGYKGFSLMKTNKIDEAIVPLTKSYELRTAAMKNVALVNEKRDIDKKKFNQQEKKESIQVERCLVKCCQLKGIDVPLPPLTKFSRTAHLFNNGGTAVTSDDLVMPKEDLIYDQLADGNTTLFIEEKVDGANFGLSLAANGKIFAQNRSHYVTSGDHSQFSPLAAYLEENRAALTDILGHHEQVSKVASQGLILYGEWVVAKHSIPYHKLPGHFIAFDIYDRKAQRFWSRKRFHNIMRGSGIPVVPMIKVGKLESFERTSMEKSSDSFKKDLVDLLDTSSQFRSDGGHVEGIILRIDDDGEGWLKSRSKIVRPDFVAGCQEGHWTRRDYEKQTVDYEFAAEYLERCYVCAVDDAN